MSNERTSLIRALHEKLVPAFVKNGFEMIPLFPDEQSSHELRFAFPLGRLKRTRNDNFELVEIQLDKHGSAKCRLNFGLVPPEGVDHPVKHVRQEEACVQFLASYCQLYSRPFFRRWFSASAGLLDADKDARTSDVAERIAALVPEVENWFATGRIGRHLHHVAR